jgi:imidazolonepropionase-like amidohydrolase
LTLTHVTVIDVASGESRADQTLVIASNRIARLGPSATTLAPRGASVVDASGAFVIPGLWDMHVHLFGHAPSVAHDERLPLFVANGVTGVRIMWTTLEDIRTVRGWRRDEAAGALLGPRFVAGSTIIDGPGSYWPTALVVTSAAQAHRVVDSLAHGGAEFIKVYTVLGREAYFAIADETKRLGIPFAGHLPLSITAAEASDAGQKSIEHLGFMDDCSTARDQIVRARKDTSIHVEGGIDQLALSTYRDSLCGALFRRFVKNGTWQVPTISVLRMGGLTLDSALALQPYSQYATAEERASWERRSRSITPQGADRRRRYFQKDLEVVVAMQRAGVPILAGTDVGNPWLVAGYSLHAELGIFVQAGMPPLAALQTATINPARYLGALDSLGTIEQGKIADLVILDADPLVDIRNVDRIRAVVLNGRLLTRSVLDSLLAVARRRTP